MIRLRRVKEGGVPPFGVSVYDKTCGIIVRISLFLTWKQKSVWSHRELWGQLEVLYYSCGKHGKFDFRWIALDVQPENL